MCEGRNDTLEEELRELAIAAQSHPPQSPKRQFLLNQLVEKIWHSGQLCCPYQGRFPPELYEEIHDEAGQQLWIYICTKIERFDPNRASVLAWVNYLFKKRFFPEVMKEIIARETATVTENSLANLEENPLLSELLREIIIEDPDNSFKTTHVKGEPRANWQFISIAKLEGKTWKEIALEVERPLNTVREWYIRNTPAMAEKIKHYLNNRSS